MSCQQGVTMAIRKRDLLTVERWFYQLSLHNVPSGTVDDGEFHQSVFHTQCFCTPPPPDPHPASSQDKPQTRILLTQATSADDERKGQYVFLWWPGSLMMNKAFSDLWLLSITTNTIIENDHCDMMGLIVWPILTPEQSFHFTDSHLS